VIGIATEAEVIQEDAGGDFDDATSSIASEGFEEWERTRGASKPNVFTVLEQEAQLMDGEDAYEDVESEDESDSQHWYIANGMQGRRWAGRERRLSPV
jgi:hypothetical protein